MTGQEKRFLTGLVFIGVLSVVVVSIRGARSGRGGVSHRDLPADVVRQEQPVFVTSIRSQHQSKKERTFSPAQYAKTLTLPSDKIGVPGRVRVAANGEIFALDMKGRHVKTFLPNGTALGAVPDLAQTQWAYAVDFAITPRYLAMAGPNSGLYLFPFSNNSPRSKIGPKALRLEAVDDTSFVAELPFGKEMFGVYSAEGKCVRQFGALLNNQSANAIAILGNMAFDNESKTIFCAGIYAGFLAAYGIDGRLKYMVETIERAPIPVIEVTRSGARRIPFSAPFVCRSISVEGGKIFFLTDAPLGARLQKSVIDVYNTRDGAYLYSLPAPERCRELTVANGTFYTTSDSGVSSWIRRK
jgi:hypothetical protein